MREFLDRDSVLSELDRQERLLAEAGRHGAAHALVVARRHVEQLCVIHEAGAGAAGQASANEPDAPTAGDHPDRGEARPEPDLDAVRQALRESEDVAVLDRRGLVYLWMPREVYAAARKAVGL